MTDNEFIERLKKSNVLTFDKLGAEVFAIGMWAGLFGGVKEKGKQSSGKLEHTEIPIPEYPPKVADLVKATEPLHEYLLKYGNPHTCVIVTQYAATVKQDEIGVSFVKSAQNDRTAEFEREIRDLMNNE